MKNALDREYPDEEIEKIKEELEVLEEMSERCKKNYEKNKTYLTKSLGEYDEEEDFKNRDFAQNAIEIYLKLDKRIEEKKEYLEKISDLTPTT